VALIFDTLHALHPGVDSHDYGQPAGFSGKWPGFDDDDAHTCKSSGTSVIHADSLSV
jgi:hypothetical protein